MTLIISEIALRLAVADPQGGPQAGSAASLGAGSREHGPAGERDGPARPALTPLQRREIVDEAVRVTLRVLAMGEAR